MARFSCIKKADIPSSLAGDNLKTSSIKFLNQRRRVMFTNRCDGTSAVPLCQLYSPGTSILDLGPASTSYSHTGVPYAFFLYWESIGVQYRYALQNGRGIEEYRDVRRIRSSVINTRTTWAPPTSILIVLIMGLPQTSTIPKTVTSTLAPDIRIFFSLVEGWQVAYGPIVIHSVIIWQAIVWLHFTLSIW